MPIPCGMGLPEEQEPCHPRMAVVRVAIGAVHGAEPLNFYAILILVPVSVSIHCLLTVQRSRARVPPPCFPSSSAFYLHMSSSDKIMEVAAH
jgi:hypothetical protein